MGIQLNTWYAKASAAAAGGALGGVLLGAFMDLILGAFGHSLPSVVPIAMFVCAAIGFMTVAIVETGGGVAWRLISGTRGLAKQKEYSYAQSLVARGRYLEAVAEYAKEVELDPLPATPYLRAAAILRDELGRHEDALEWLERARRDARLGAGQEQFITREIIALYTDKLQRPRRAIPELARLAERAAGTRTGEWAAAELERLKRAFELTNEDDDA